MAYSEETIEKLTDGYSAIEAKYENLFYAFITRQYKNAEADEYAKHGFARRLKMLLRCVQKIFQTIPPEGGDLPSRDALSDATICLQSFIVNTFGCFDNLAWVWVHETGLKQENGDDLSRSHVGLRATNRIMRSSFRENFQNYLAELDEWFDYLTSYRDALGHRIPLYIPPHTVKDENSDRYQELEKLMSEALIEGDVQKYEQLSAEQDGIVFFRPVMIHSYNEAKGPMFIHPQLIADFNTVESVGWKMLEELNHHQAKQLSMAD